MIKVRIRKGVYRGYVVPNMNDIIYHLAEGFAVDFVRVKEMPSCFKMYFDTCKKQREVISALHWCGVNTNWNFDPQKEKQ